VVEDGVHSAGSEFADPRGHVPVAVVDGCDALLAQRLVVARGRRADHLRAGGPGELDEDRADTAVGAVHQDGLPRPDTRLAVQHLPGGDAVEHQGLRLRRADPGRHLHHVRRVDEHVAGPAADLEQGGHPGAGQARFDARPGRQHRPDHVVTGDEGEGRLVVVALPAHLLLGEGDPGRLHPDQDLAGPRHGDLTTTDLETFGLHLARQYDLDEFCGVHDGLRCLRLRGVARVAPYGCSRLLEVVTHREGRSQ
jgi:hypothetical protein